MGFHKHTAHNEISGADSRSLLFTAACRSFERDQILGGTWAKRAGLAKAMATYFSGKAEGNHAPHPISIFQILAWRLPQVEVWYPSSKLSYGGNDSGL